MKTVKILCGGYGLKVPAETGIRTKLILRGEVCELPDSEAAELIAANMAVPVVATPQERGDGIRAGENTPAAKTPQEGFLDPEQLKTMTVAQLKQLAEDMGLDSTACKKKAELIERITAESVIIEEEEQPEGNEDEEDGEAPPELGAEAPVV